MKQLEGRLSRLERAMSEEHIKPAMSLAVMWQDMDTGEVVARVPAMPIKAGAKLDYRIGLNGVGYEAT